MNLKLNFDDLDQKWPVKVLLIDDQEAIGLFLKNMFKGEKDIFMEFCNEPTKALQVAEEFEPTVILQDLVMPQIDGLLLLRYLRANEKTKSVPMIVLSGTEEAQIKAEAFALGANDYVVKMPDRVEMLARIRYHSHAYTRLLETQIATQKLLVSEKKLQMELQAAAKYMLSMLPPPIKEGPIQLDWRFIPSLQVGGDCFGYRQIDDDSFVLYVVDVAGHGIRAALLSMSIMHCLSGRMGTLEADLKNPSDVLHALNSRFPMENNDNMFFSIWYGLFQISSNKLTYASAGHPPAVLLDKREVQAHKLLQTGSTVIGAMPDSAFESESCVVPKGSKLFIFSDGAYELVSKEGKRFYLEDLVQVICQPPFPGVSDLDRLMHHAQHIIKSEHFVDDYCMLEVLFN